MKHELSQKIIKQFDSFVEKTIFKLKDKTNIFFIKNSKVSNFNKLLIAFISLLFLYLFYLSIPTLYDKTWVQNNIESKLYKEFKVNFSISSDISYRILPAPHFLIKDSKIFKGETENAIPLSEIKNLKVFVSQANFFKKEKTVIKNIIIDKANFSLTKDDFKLFNNASNKKFSNKKIKVRHSNIFFKNNDKETIAIIKLSKAFLFFDDLKLLNIFSLKGELFNIPFTFDLTSETDNSKYKEIHIKAKKLKLKIFNSSIEKDVNLISGSNIISVLNSKIFTKYNTGDNLIIFESANSTIKNSKVDYKGKLSFNPFDLKLDIKLETYTLSKLLNIDSILSEFIKTKLLFNENISVNSSISTNSENREEIFDSSKINLNILNGKIDFDQTKLINDKIGILELNNSHLFFERDTIILNTDILIDIKNYDNLYSFLQTSKKYRKPIKNIFINLDYDFLTSQIKFNIIKLDNVIGNDGVLEILEEFNDNNSINLNKSRRIVNKFFSFYEG